MLPDESSSADDISTETALAHWRLRDVKKVYQKRLVVDIASLDFHDGESVALVGNNGSGKSTLLRLLAGIAPVSSGSITKSAAARDLRAAIVPQAGGSYTGSTVLENLNIRAGLYGIKLSAAAESAWYISTFNLDRFLNVQVGRLSGGFQRLCAIACALCVEPSCLFLDEPFSGLDATQAGNLRSCLARLTPELRLMAITGHSADEFAGAYRIINIQDGKVA
jgi:putative spermidine/putrescine transport system ATP-binding protein